MKLENTLIIWVLRIVRLLMDKKKYINDCLSKHPIFLLSLLLQVTNIDLKRDYNLAVDLQAALYTLLALNCNY